MLNKRFYARNKMAILTACLLIATCLIASPQGIMCTDLFSSEANTTIVTDLCNFYAKWWWIPLICTAFITAVGHDDNKKHAGIIAMIIMVIVFIAAKNIDVLQATFNHMAEWFGGSTSITNTFDSLQPR